MRTAITVVLMIILLSSCGTDKSFVVGFIYSGKIDDGGMTAVHDEGRLALHNIPGVTTVYREGVSDQNSDSQRAMRDMIERSGAKVIFATSFGYGEHVFNVARDYPQVKFYHFAGDQTADNVSTYHGKTEEVKYLAGMVAGFASKSGQIGYISSYEIPENIKNINAFTLGVLSVKPTAEVYVKWTNAWNDPKAERNALTALLNRQGEIDVVTHGLDSDVVLFNAAEKGLSVIGNNLHNKNIPKLLTSTVWDLGIFYTDVVNAIQNDKYEAGVFNCGMDTEVIGLAPISGAMSYKEVSNAEENIKSGDFEIFKGVMYDNESRMRLWYDEVMPYENIYFMNWLVEGVKLQ